MTEYLGGGKSECGESDGSIIGTGEGEAEISGVSGPSVRVATKIFKDFGGALNKAFIIGWEPVSIVHYTRPGTCINRPLH